MKLYEIDNRIEELLSTLEPNPETGEVSDMESVVAELERLDGERLEKLTNCAKAYFEAKAAAAQVKAEKLRLSDKQVTLERRAERILNFLAFVADGKKTDCGVATLSFPKARPSLVQTDAAAAADWLENNGYPDLFTPQAPKLSANDVKELLVNGADIPGVALEYKQKAVLK